MEQARSEIRMIGRYAMFDPIASGGMATVHLGRLLGPAGFSRLVAIKRLHAQFATEPEFVAAFVDEARLAGRIRHPNVVPTLDVLMVEHELFLVLDYVQGQSLARLLDAAAARGELPDPRIASTILTNVLEGLHAAHVATSETGAPLGIVHRDVSPQNVLVGTDGLARVFDFGVAKAANRLQSTRPGGLKGKLAYMAPEQILSGEVTRRADVYSAAIVLWETLTARALFKDGGEVNIMSQILEAEVPPPSRFAPAVPPALDAIVMKALARGENDRYATAREFAVALEAAMGLAPPREIGAWVERLGGDVLIERAERVVEIERASAAGQAEVGLLDARGVAPAGRVAPPAAAPASELAAPALAPAGKDDTTDPDRTRLTVSALEAPAPRPQAALQSGAPNTDATPTPADPITHTVVLRPRPGEAMPRARWALRAAIAAVVLGVVALLFARSSPTDPTARVEDAPPSGAAADPGRTAPDPARAATAAEPEQAGAPARRTAGDDPRATSGARDTPRASSDADQPEPESKPKDRPARTKRARRTRTPSPTPAAAETPCDPPYWIDADGIRRLKRECM